MTVPFAARLADHGERVALVTGDREITYRQLATLVADRATQLGPGRRLVLLAARNHPDAVVTYLAALAAGHPLLLVGADNDRAIEGWIDRYDPDVVVRPEIYEPDRWTVLERRRGSRHRIHPELALLLSTSGSTGSPKLVRLSAENVQSNADAIGQYLEIGETDRGATSLPMAYCYGLSVINSHLARGASVVLTDLSVVSAAFWELLRATHATSFAGVPYTFELLERVGFGDIELPDLRYVTQAGGRLDPARVAEYAELGRRRGWQLYVMYGQTEATARMAYLPPELAADHPGSIGRPIPGGSFELADVPGAEPGVGELVYRGPNVMLGYAEEPADLALGRTIGPLRTGDLARRNARGLFEIVGRRGQWLKVAGLRVDLQQVERLLERLLERGRIAACATGSDEQLVVAVEGEADADRVHRIVRDAMCLPTHAVRVVPVARLPRLANGKLDRATVSAMAARDAPTAPTPPKPEAGVESIRALYADVLDRPMVRDEDSFVSLGGDSLSYVEASLGLEELLGRLPDNWAAMPVRELAALARPRPRESGLRMALRHWRSIETGVALRALAIVLIVATHADLISVMGGAHVLMAVAGFNFARFQLTDTARRERVRSQLRAISRIAAPGLLWIGAMLLLTDDYSLANLVLLNAVVGPEQWSTGWHFWFIEVLLYVLVGMVLFTAVPAVDRAERRWPFGIAVAVLALGLAIRFGIVDLGLLNTKPVLWLFALGWAASRARSWWQRGLVLAVALAAVPGFFGMPEREVVILAGVVALALVPRLRFPDLVARGAAILASASLYVYLVHWQLYPGLMEIAPLLAVVASLAAGIGTWLVASRAPWFGRELARRWQVATRWPWFPARGPVRSEG